MRLRPFIITILSFLVFIGIGAYAYFFFVTPYIVYKQTSTTSEHNDTLLRTLDIIGKTSNSFFYGIVVSIDEKNRTLTLVKQNFANSSAPPWKLKMKILNRAYIAKQTLVISGGVVTGLSNEQSASLADIHPGDAVATLIRTKETGELTTSYILFGTPL